MDAKAGTSKAAAATRWEEEALRRFYSAFHKHGTSWAKVRTQLWGRRRVGVRP